MSCTIALVEDDDVIRESISEFLISRGYKVQAYRDRASALSAFSESLPDVAILDVVLGDERDGGFKICSELRSKSQTLAIIFLTSYAAEADRISGLRTGADDYLS